MPYRIRVPAGPAVRQSSPVVADIPLKPHAGHSKFSGFARPGRHRRCVLISPPPVARDERGIRLRVEGVGKFERRGEGAGLNLAADVLAGVSQALRPKPFLRKDPAKTITGRFLGFGNGLLPIAALRAGEQIRVYNVLEPKIDRHDDLGSSGNFEGAR
jgi:hypothetical protein